MSETRKRRRSALQCERCKRASVAKGLCSRHYMRVRRIELGARCPEDSLERIRKIVAEALETLATRGVEPASWEDYLRAIDRAAKRGQR